MHVVGYLGIWCMGYRFVPPDLDSVDGSNNGPALRIYSRGVSPHANGSLPVVFVHGIGIGFMHYLALIASLPADVPVYLVEWPHVSMQITGGAVPSINTTVATISARLRADGIQKACFVGHSLGTTAVAWMLHDSTARDLVATTVLLDPVTFMLCDSGVAYNFLHRTPTSVIELLMHNFVSRELFIAHTLSRHFSWSHNSLFVEDLPRPRHRATPTSDGSTNNTTDITTTIVLSSGDSIVPTDRVKKYFAQHQHRKDIEVITLDDMQHGQAMVSLFAVRMIAGRIRAACTVN
mmetsp:Transcript_43093/g.116300  ORF Transcript_43093/g.116300 Transcript_43093/m.116300 type:complete len:292 (+) Transcript_43093:945-1820(+)